MYTPIGFEHDQFVDLSLVEWFGIEHIPEHQKRSWFESNPDIYGPRTWRRLWVRKRTPGAPVYETRPAEWLVRYRFISKETESKSFDNEKDCREFVDLLKRSMRSLKQIQGNVA